MGAAVVGELAVDERIISFGKIAVRQRELHRRPLVGDDVVEPVFGRQFGFEQIAESVSGKITLAVAVNR
ncbi:hypothetical protein SDC9_210374 [bioreactor metagenome]|uniref:Uncharacterized protein n=1 Tax=bioreactor metagenome TaxID=1076179 RepID=A0A645JHC0_9ZZZZ